jgi:hypothetical protein
VTRKKLHRILNRKQQWQQIICDLNIAIHYLTVVSCFPDRGNAHNFLEVILNTQFLVQLCQDKVTPGCSCALSCGLSSSLGLQLSSQTMGQLSALPRGSDRRKRPPVSVSLEREKKTKQETLNTTSTFCSFLRS